MSATEIASAFAPETELRVIRMFEARKMRVTAARVVMLGLFLREGVALSQPEIERTLQDSCDRVTIYRNLSAFLEHGILHKVLDDQGAMKYALCPPACDPSHAHHHNHVHFKCDRCGNTQCINEVEVPPIRLPEGFSPKEINILIQGICAVCTAQATI